MVGEALEREVGGISGGFGPRSGPKPGEILWFWLFARDLSRSGGLALGQAAGGDEKEQSL